MSSIGPMLMSSRSTSTLVTLCAMANRKLPPPCSTVGIWKPRCWRLPECARGETSLRLFRESPRTSRCGDPGPPVQNGGIDVGVIRAAPIARPPTGVYVSCIKFVRRGFRSIPLPLLPCKSAEGFHVHGFGPLGTPNTR
jgi:hypothetical protein